MVPYLIWPRSHPRLSSYSSDKVITFVFTTILPDFVTTIYTSLYLSNFTYLISLYIFRFHYPKPPNYLNLQPPFPLYQQFLLWYLKSFLRREKLCLNNWDVSVEEGRGRGLESRKGRSRIWFWESPRPPQMKENRENKGHEQGLVLETWISRMMDITGMGRWTEEK